MRVASYILLLLTFFSVSAQPENDGEASPKKYSGYAIPKATIKINIPCLLDPLKSSLFVASDIRLARKWSADIGAGWFMGSWANPMFVGESMNGLRARLGFKYHYVVTKRIAPYVGVEGKMNLIYEKKYERVCRYGCQYIEDMKITSVTQTYGAALKAGIQLYLGKKENFLIDAYSGLGFKFINKEMRLPADSETLPTFDMDIFQFDRSPGKYRSPDFLFGFYFGYCFAR
jgi:hypothetical protein